MDRPAVCFYEINGFDQDPENPDRFNVYSHPSWYPVIKLARDRTDRIVRRGISLVVKCDPWKNLKKVEEWDEDGRRMIRTRICTGKRELTSLRRRDVDQDTVWCVEPLVKDAEDFKAWLSLPRMEFDGVVDPNPVITVEQALGETGIVMIDTGDPLCQVASLFDIGDFMVVAFTEQRLFRQALEKAAEFILARTEAVARVVPGRLWRIVGAEYASPPYLPPDLFRDYVVRYERAMVEAIQRYGGFARIHCHGRIREILDDIVSTGCMGVDPIEPPPQGNVSLGYVRERYGRELVLFGNIEVAELEGLPPDRFESRVRSAVCEGTAGEGRGFVLMPTGSPIGRVLPERTARNYEIMVRVIEELEGRNATEAR
ncbi:MAG: uroporphyrinogen decarboxylase family protein [Kiritimatiellia bacterium]